MKGNNSFYRKRANAVQALKCIISDLFYCNAAQQYKTTTTAKLWLRKWKETVLMLAAQHWGQQGLCSAGPAAATPRSMMTLVCTDVGW